MNTPRFIHGALRRLYKKMPVGVQEYRHIRKFYAEQWTQAGIIFVHVPKAAGSSVNQALYGEYTGHIRARTIKYSAPMLFNRLPSFSVIRNPWDRCLSSYRFAVAGSGKGTGLVAVLRDSYQYRIPEFETFEEFVEGWLYKQKISQLDPIFRPQHEYVLNKKGEVLVNFVGRLEAIEKVEAFVSENVNFKVKFGHENRTGHSVNYRDWFTPRLKNLVAEIYRKDIEAFGYDF